MHPHGEMPSKPGKRFLCSSQQLKGWEGKQREKKGKIFTLGVFLKQKMLTNPVNYQL